MMREWLCYLHWVQAIRLVVASQDLFKSFLKLQRRYFVSDCLQASFGGVRFGSALLLRSENYDENIDDGPILVPCNQ